jgi:hypothetical protein
VTHRFALLASAVGLAASAVSTPAFAQGRAQRPVTGIFGGSGYDAEPVHVLDTTVSVGGAFESNEHRGLDQRTLSPFEQSGFYTSLDGALNYGWRGEKVAFGANAGAQNRYYAETGDFLSVDRYGGVGLVASFARRTQLEVNQTVSYSPAYFSGMFPALSSDVPGSVDALGPDYAVSDLYAFTYETSAGISHGLTERTTLGFSSSVKRTDFSERSGYQDLVSYSVGGRLDRQLTQNAKARFGYYYRRGQYAFVNEAVDTTIHDLDVGLDYDKALSLTRRTHIDFGMGSSIVTEPISGGDATAPVEDRLQYELKGSVGLSHEMGQTWLARVAYERGLGLVEGFPEPVFADGVSASLGGFFNRRVELRIDASYANGNIGRVAESSRLEAYSGLARLQYAINRNLAASGEYFFYHYDIGRAVMLPLGVSHFQDRGGIRGWLTMWFPTLRR